ncbi:MAG: hypothetical protein QG622_2989 [Actinomycetota bacterium]|nr:hypothetical protein [Actinomycetota bacterium]
MKFDERRPKGRADAPVVAVDSESRTAEARTAEARTQDRVCRAVLESGPITAAELATALGLTTAAVRRHLDALLDQGLVTGREAPAGAPRGRGRPAKLFVLSDAGHATLATGYDDLATQALRHLSDVAGPDAVRRFATERLATFEARYRPVVDAAGPDPRARAAALAAALSADGFAASTRGLALAGAPAPVSSSGGAQLCQGHCPVQHAAREFPEFCEVETDTFSRLLGVHVQRLATLAHGEHVCTTHVPGPTAAPGSTDRSNQRSDER